MAWTQSQANTQTQNDQSQGDGNGGKEKGKFAQLLNPGKNIAQSWGVDIAKELSDYAESLGITLDCEIAPLLSNDEDDGLRVDFAEAALMLQGSTTIYCRKVEHLYNLVLAAVEIVNHVKSRSNRNNKDGTANDDHDDEDTNDVWDTEDIDFLDLDDVFPVAERSKIHRDEREHIASARKMVDPTKLVEVPPLLRQPTNRDSDKSNNILRMDFGTVDESGAMLLPGALESNYAKGGFLDLVARDAASERLSIDGNDDIDDFHADSPEILRNEHTPLPPSPGDNLPLPDVDVPLFRLSNDLPELAQPRQSEQKPVAPERVDPHRELNPHDDAGIRARPAQPSRLAKSTFRPKRPKSTKSLFSYLAEIDDTTDITRDLWCGRTRGHQVTFSGLREPAKAMRRKVAAAKRVLYKDSKGAYSFADEAQAINENRGNDFELEENDFDNDDDEMDNDLGIFDNAADDDADEPILSLGFDDDDTGMQMRAYNNDGDSALQEIVQDYQQACLNYVEKTSMLWEKKAVNADIVERVEEWSSRIRPKLEEESKRPVFDIHVSGDLVLKQVHRIEERQMSQSQSEETEPVPMKQAFQAKKQFEVCRLFLATLQLANNYDVEICPGDDFEPSLKLLDSARVEQIRRMPLAENDENVQNGMGLKRAKADIAKVDVNTANLVENAALKGGRRNSKKRRRKTLEVVAPGRNRVSANTYLR